MIWHSGLVWYFEFFYIGIWNSRVYKKNWNKWGVIQEKIIYRKGLLFIYLFLIIEEPSMVKPLGLSMGTQTSGEKMYIVGGEKTSVICCDSELIWDWFIWKNKYYGSCCITWGKLLIGIGEVGRYNLGVWLEFPGGVISFCLFWYLIFMNIPFKL